MKTSYLRVWFYRVRPKKIREFEENYSSKGPWYEIFKTFPGYQKTVLLKHLEDVTHYMTLDYWQDEASFNSAEITELPAFKSLDIKCEEFTEKEEFAGSWQIISRK